MRLGLVGAGRIGRPMVRRLLAAGHETRVLARSGRAAAELRADGAAIAGSVAEVADSAEIVLLCVSSDEQVREVAADLLPAMERGAVIVTHTTGRPRTVAELARAGRERDVAVVDAPVSGGPAQVEAGQITLFVGGSDEAVARVRPVLSAYADPLLHVGPSGWGQGVKLVNNALFAASIALVTDALRVGVELGVPEDVLLSALPHGSGASRALSVVAGSGSVDATVRAVGEFVGKDVRVVREIADELGVHLGALADLLDGPSGRAVLNGMPR